MQTYNKLPLGREGQEGYGLENKKTSFLLYFDNYPMLAALPPEQRGWLITALYLYADRLRRGEEIGMEEVLEAFPQMSEPAQMACSCMGSSILRDTRRWFSQRAVRSQRREQSRERTAAGSQTQLDRERRDIELARRALRQNQAGENSPA